jgi:hypothetical protein
LPSWFLSASENIGVLALEDVDEPPVPELLEPEPLELEPLPEAPLPEEPVPEEPLPDDDGEADEPPELDVCAMATLDSASSAAAVAVVTILNMFVSSRER